MQKGKGGVFKWCKLFAHSKNSSFRFSGSGSAVQASKRVGQDGRGAKCTCRGTPEGLNLALWFGSLKKQQQISTLILVGVGDAHEKRALGSHLGRGCAVRANTNLICV